MKRDFLEGLGLDKDTVDKILDENSRDIGREKQKADQAREDLNAARQQLTDRDYADAMTRAITAKGVKFSSKAAEKAYLADLKEKHLELKDGELTGFDEWHKAQLEADPTAFQSGKPAPTFVKPIGQGGAPAAKSKGAMYAQQFNAQFAQTPNKE